MRVALRQEECSFRFGGYLTNVLPIANFKGVAQQSIVQFHLTKGQVVKSGFFYILPSLEGLQIVPCDDRTNCNSNFKLYL
jgi:hypothetical protein